jgi:hypothetical protein
MRAPQLCSLLWRICCALVICSMAKKGQHCCIGSNHLGFVTRLCRWPWRGSKRTLPKSIVLAASRFRTPSRAANYFSGLYARCGDAWCGGQDKRERRQVIPRGPTDLHRHNLAILKQRPHLDISTANSEFSPTNLLIRPRCGASIARATSCPSIAVNDTCIAKHLFYFAR